MKLDDDDFEIFGLPRAFTVDQSDLAQRWRDLQAKVHPDRFASEGAASQRIAMQWAVRVNEAYGRLKSPLKRAAYLCELSGHPIDAESNTAMPPDFLMQQMAWRESLEEAKAADDVERLDEQVRDAEGTLLKDIGALLDAGQGGNAAAKVRALMFLDRFRADIDRRLEMFET